MKKNKKSNSINLTTIKNRDYIGKYPITSVYVKGKISVENQHIINIEILKHDNGFGKSAKNIVNDITKN